MWTETYLLSPISPVLLCCPNPQPPPPNLTCFYILSYGLLERAIKQNLVQIPIRTEIQSLLWLAELGVLQMGGGVPQAEETQVRGREAEGIPALWSKQLTMRRCPCHGFVISNGLYVLSTYCVDLKSETVCFWSPLFFRYHVGARDTSFCTLRLSAHHLLP